MTPLSEVVVQNTKPPLPTLWFDTAVAIDLAKMELGEKIEPKRKERLARFAEVIKSQVHCGKLLCVEGDQREELQGERLESEIRKTLNRYSLGVRFRHRLGIQHHQVFTAMEAYVSGKQVFEVSYTGYFHEDPIAELERNRSSQYLIYVQTSLGAELLERFKRNKSEAHRKLEGLRQETTGAKIVYDAQLALERTARADLMLNTMRKVQNEPQIIDSNDEALAVEYLEFRHTLGPIRNDPTTTFNELYQFMKSPYCRSLPFEDISCRLLADLIVRPRPCSSGDAMDVDLLSVALPVCHFVVADKDMVDRLERRKIASDYHCQVFSTRTLHKLSDRLEAL
jgi:hypothetical protein